MTKLKKKISPPGYSPPTPPSQRVSRQVQAPDGRW